VREIQLSDAYAIALGAGILGTGGGGNTYLGRIWLETEFKARNISCRVIEVDEVDDNAVVCAVGTMGAPTVGVEKILPYLVHQESYFLTPAPFSPQE